MKMHTFRASRLPAALDLRHQVLLITGASGGIGKTLALSAAKHGATLILLGKSLKRLESVYDEIMAQGGPTPVLMATNLLQFTPEAAARLCEDIQGLFPHLNGIVHLAGISGQIAPLEHLQPHQWQEVIHLNLNVPYLLTHALLPLLKQTPSSSVIFTVAPEARRGKAYWSAYSASKQGIKGLAQALHEEVEANTDMRVNCVNPGRVHTPFRTRTYPAADEQSYSSPQHTAQAYLYLLSEQAKAIRGRWVNIQDAFASDVCRS